MLRIFLVLFAIIFLLNAYLSAGPGEPGETDYRFLAPDQLAFLREMARDVVEASRVRAGEKVGEYGPNNTGGTVIRPGGQNCYPAFWIRDYAMSLDSGLVALEEQRHMLLLTAKHQPDREISLKSGSVIPAGSIPDHITFRDQPIFFPGTINDFEGQGGERWGEIPCLDDAFFFIKMAWFYVEQSGDTSILTRTINGKTLLSRLEEAFSMPPSDPGDHLVYASDGWRGIGFGFTDTTTHTGKLLIASLLKFRASRQLAELCRSAGCAALAARYHGIASTMKSHFESVFIDDSGFLKASTEKSSQPDVWGTALAVYFSALEEESAFRACETLADSLERGKISWKGNIRHVPTGMDYSESTSWEVSLAEKNTYQNGAYWGTPTGWVCHAVARADPGLARQLAGEYIQELKDGDFRRGGENGSPWECVHPNGHRQNPVYMTSVTAPLGVFLRKD